MKRGIMTHTHKMLSIGMLTMIGIFMVSLLGDSITGAAIQFNPNFSGIAGILQNPPIYLDFMLFFALFMSVAWISFSNIFKIKERADLRGAVVVLSTVVALIMTIGLLFNPVYPLSIADLGIFVVIFLILLALALLYGLAIKLVGDNNKFIALLLAVVLLLLIYFFYLLSQVNWQFGRAFRDFGSFGITGGFGILDWAKYVLALIILLLLFWLLYKFFSTMIGGNKWFLPLLLSLVTLGLIFLIYLFATNNWNLGNAFGNFSVGMGWWEALKGLFTGTNLWLGLPLVIALLTIIFWLVLDNLIPDAVYKSVIALLLAVIIALFGFVMAGGTLSQLGIHIDNTKTDTTTPTVLLECSEQFKHCDKGNYWNSVVCDCLPISELSLTEAGGALLQNNEEIIALKIEQNGAYDAMYKKKYGDKEVLYNDLDIWKDCGAGCSGTQNEINKRLENIGLNKGPIALKETLEMKNVVLSCPSEKICEEQINTLEWDRMDRLIDGENTKNLLDVKKMAEVRKSWNFNIDNINPKPVVDPKKEKEKLAKELAEAKRLADAKNKGNLKDSSIDKIKSSITKNPGTSTGIGGGALLVLALLIWKGGAVFNKAKTKLENRRNKALLKTCKKLDEERKKIFEEWKKLNNEVMQFGPPRPENLKELEQLKNLILGISWKLNELDTDIVNNNREIIKNNIKLAKLGIKTAKKDIKKIKIWRGI